MVINYFGEGCFRVQSGETSLLVNPANNRLKANATIRTIVTPQADPHPDEITFPGEYEVGGIDIQGIGIPGESTDKYLKTAYVVKWEDIRLVFLGHLSHMPSDDIVEELGEPDVLFVPAGDPHYLDAADAAKLVKRLAPAVVIPAYYKSSADLLKALGVKGEKAEEKFVFRKKDLAEMKGKVVVLAASG